MVFFNLILSFAAEELIKFFFGDRHSGIIITYMFFSAKNLFEGHAINVLTEARICYKYNLLPFSL